MISGPGERQRSRHKGGDWLAVVEGREQKMKHETGQGPFWVGRRRAECWQVGNGKVAQRRCGQSRRREGGGTLGPGALPFLARMAPPAIVSIGLDSGGALGALHLPRFLRGRAHLPAVFEVDACSFRRAFGLTAFRGGGGRPERFVGRNQPKHVKSLPSLSHSMKFSCAEDSNIAWPPIHDLARTSSSTPPVLAMCCSPIPISALLPSLPNAT